MKSPITGKEMSVSQERRDMIYRTEKFKETNAGDIAEISHKEPAWKDNIDEKKSFLSIMLLIW